MIHPTFVELANEYGGEKEGAVVFVEVDVDDADDVSFTCRMLV